MKNNLKYLALSTCLFFAACHFSAGYKKDLATGLSFKYSGLLVKNVFFAGPDNNLMPDNRVQLNTQVGIVAVGVAGYTLKDGKAFPGMTLTVTDKNGLSVLPGGDLLAEGNGYPPEAAGELRGSLTVGQPMKSGETYHVKLHVWDKLKPASELNAEMDVIVN